MTDKFDLRKYLAEARNPKRVGKPPRTPKQAKRRSGVKTNKKYLNQELLQQAEQAFIESGIDLAKAVWIVKVEGHNISNPKSVPHTVVESLIAREGIDSGNVYYDFEAGEAWTLEELGLKRKESDISKRTQQKKVKKIYFSVFFDVDGYEYIIAQ